MLGAYVEDRKVETGRDDSLRHRGAHRPESYESGALHLFLPEDPSMIVPGCLCGDTSVLQRGFDDSAAVELIYGGAVDLLPGRLALGEVRDAFLLLAALSGAAFRIEGLSSLPDCLLSPMVGRVLNPRLSSVSARCLLSTSCAP